VEQEPPLPFGVVIEAIGLCIRGDMGLDEPGAAAVLDVHKSFGQAYLTGANGLYLAAHQGHTCLEALQQKILKACFAVCCNDLYIFGHESAF
jgi:hypothetical protein